MHASHQEREPKPGLTLIRLEISREQLVNLVLSEWMTLNEVESVKFRGRGPGGFVLEGVTKELELLRKEETAVLRVGLGTLTTGIALRDETSKYPFAELSFRTDTFNSVRGSLPGVLTLHGQSQRVTVEYELKRQTKTLSVHASFLLNTNDFEIQRPAYLGITINPDIEVMADFTVTRQ